MLRPLHQDLLLLQSLQKSKNLSLALSHLPNSLNIILEEKFLFGRGKQGADALSVCAQSFARRKTKKAHTAPPLQKIFYDIIFSYGCMIGRIRHNPPFLNNRRRRSTIIHYSLFIKTAPLFSYRSLGGNVRCCSSYTIASTSATAV